MKNYFSVSVASEEYFKFIPQICAEMEASAKKRGTGIAKRTHGELEEKMRERKAVIAVTPAGEWAGFCYIESWQGNEFVSNSGLIVAPQFRELGLAKTIKQQIFILSQKKFPQAKIFGLTTSAAVMKINSDLGYKPVTYATIPEDDAFWEGCKSCVNYDILVSKHKKNCLCTAMLFDPTADEQKPQQQYIKKIKTTTLTLQPHNGK